MRRTIKQAEPFYTYQCRKCGHETNRGPNDNGAFARSIKCPKCGSPAHGGAGEVKESSDAYWDRQLQKLYKRRDPLLLEDGNPLKEAAMDGQLNQQALRNLQKINAAKAAKPQPPSQARQPDKIKVAAIRSLLKAASDINRAKLAVGAEKLAAVCHPSQLENLLTVKYAVDLGMDPVSAVRAGFPCCDGRRAAVIAAATIKAASISFNALSEDPVAGMKGVGGDLEVSPMVATEEKPTLGGKDILSSATIGSS